MKNFRNILIIVIIILIIVGGGGLYLFFNNISSMLGEPDTDNGSFNIFDTLFPFLNGTGNGGGNVPGNNGEDNGDISRTVPLLRKVSEVPTVGGYVYEDAEEELRIRYIERATGHVFETNANSFSAIRLSNTTIPGTNEVLWGSESEFILRRVTPEGGIENFFATLTGTTTDQAVRGAFLGNWQRGALDPARQTILTVTETADGSEINISNVDGSGDRIVLESPIRSWIPKQNDTQLFVQTAPDPATEGFLYRVVGSSLLKVDGGVPGLTTLLHPERPYVLIGSGGDNVFGSYVLNTTTDERINLPSGTIPEKCVWLLNDSLVLVCGVPRGVSGSAAYPNDWLLGRVSFNDEIWEFNIETGESNLLVVPQDEVGEVIDVWQPQIDATESYLVFINKRDLSFWSLRLIEEVSDENTETDSGE